ncbi:hypothetical protein niasHS_006521 [Heterodera schachtii]|uniref:F-box domain-containing protein n=1 Tax=Heterodera schachtii TaxID=97005 RepID=A0ABD2JHT1_HETSC
MTAALLVGGGAAGGVAQRRPSATLVLEMPNNQLQQHQQQQQQLRNHQPQQSVVPSSSALAKDHGNASEGGQQQQGKAVAELPNSTQQPKKQLKQMNKLTGDDLPLKVWQRIGLMASPLDRIRIGQCSKRTRETMDSTKWTDVVALTIRPIGTDETAPTANINGGSRAVPSSASLRPRPSVSSLSSAASVSLRGGIASTTRKAFRVQMALADGRAFRLRTEEGAEDAEKQLKTLLGRIDGEALRELTIWNGCLSDRFRGVLSRCCAPALRTLRLWNCSRYLSDFASSGKRRRPLASLRPRRPLLSALLALPQLRQLLILDTETPEGIGHHFPDFSESLAKKIKAPLEELQLTACRLPLSALRQLRLRCALSLRRLAIGCVWGSEGKRELYLRELGQFHALADLDLPPFLFCLVDHDQPDPQMQQLFDQLTRLKAIGFRHFKSSILFRFIELHLPDRITALRVHHSVHRMPNFAQLGHPPSPAFSAPSSSSFFSAHVPSPRPAQSVRSVFTLFSHGTAGGSPDSQRGALHRQKKGSIVSQPSSSLLSSSQSSVRSDSFSSAAAFPFRRSSVSLRSAASSSASVLPFRRPFQPRLADDAAASPSTITGAATVSSRSFSSSTVTYSSSASSTSSLGCGDKPFSTVASPTIGQYRCKSFSLGGDGTVRGAPAKRGTEKTSAMSVSSTWCTLGAFRPMPCRKSSECVPHPPRQCFRHPSPLSTGAADASQSVGGVGDNGADTAQQRLARRQLTIVAVAEERIGDSDRKNGGKRPKGRGGGPLREQWRFGIRIVYVPPSEARHSQEILGRMGSPIEAPFIYYFNKSCVVNASESREQVRLVDGDFVCPRPLSEFGTESDFENEEDEEEE